MTQLDLSSYTPASRSTDPESSRAAAKRVRLKAGTQLGTIYSVLHAEGPRWLTAHRLAVVTGIEAYTVRKRLPELERMGLVESDRDDASKPKGEPLFWRAR